MGLAVHRRENESVVLILPGGQYVTIKVVRTDRPSRGALLAIDAPEDVKIYREEILRAQVEPK